MRKREKKSVGCWRSYALSLAFPIFSFNSYRFYFEQPTICLFRICFWILMILSISMRLFLYQILFIYQNRNGKKKLSAVVRACGFDMANAFFATHNQLQFP